MNSADMKGYLSVVLESLRVSHKSGYKTPRKFHAYSVGASKTGTHSMAGIFSGFRTALEPTYEELMTIVNAMHGGKIDGNFFSDYFVKRDSILRLELESSDINVYFIEILIREFPEARFILTIRDCYSWLDSTINHELMLKSVGANLLWTPLRRFLDVQFYNREFKYSKEEGILESYKLYTLDGYLSYWNFHNRKIINSVPMDRLMVIKTNEINEKNIELSKFLGVDVKDLNMSKNHSFKNENKIDIIKTIDRDFLNLKIKNHCSDLMNKYFPEIIIK